MADYRLRLYRLFPDKRVDQIVIYLRKTNSELARKTTFEIPRMQHSYDVIRLWEVPTEELLQSTGLLPFAVLSQTDNPAEVLKQVAKRIGTITDQTERSNISASTAIIAGLVLDTIIVNRVLKEEIMKESVVYQDILAEGEVKGIQKGEANLVLKQLNRRLGDIPVNLTKQIREMSVEQLENLGEALLDFQSLEALVDWLAR